jgi:hypothetical protein
MERKLEKVGLAKWLAVTRLERWIVENFFQSI